jgi:hypothetical protein
MRRRIAVGLWMCILASGGCAAFHPLQGVPARKLPIDYRMPHRSGQTTIDLSLLRQTPPRDHLVDAGDVLGIYIEGVLGRDGDVPPVYVPQERFVPPSVGYPIAVQSDGTISLPSIGPLSVRGLTIREVEETIRRACTQGPQALLQPGQDRILVSLQRPRFHSILVIRQEADNPVGSFGYAESPIDDMEKRGTGQIVLLPAYKNDVLHALAETGGLPGLDAQNAVYIVRGQRLPAAGMHWTSPAPMPGMTIRGQSPYEQPQAWRQPNVGWAAPTTISSGVGAPHATPSGQSAANPYQSYRTGPAASSSPLPARADYWSAPAPTPPAAPSSPPVAQTAGQWGAPEVVPQPGPQMPSLTPYPEGLPLELSQLTSRFHNPTVIRIPLRTFPGEVPQFAEQDVILQDGDILFVESRETEFFYTGGLLGGGQYTLPRDYDINVLDAISIAESRGRNYWGNSLAVGGVSALNHDVTVGASKVIILRKQPDGSQLAIEVDLYRAMRDPSHQIMIWPEDRIFLRYTRLQAVVALFERHLLEGFLIGAASRTFYSN